MRAVLQVADDAAAGDKARNAEQTAWLAEVDGQQAAIEEDQGQQHELSDQESVKDGDQLDRKREEWLSMFQICVKEDRQLKTNADLRAEVAASLAERLRDHPTMPADPSDSKRPWLDVASGGRLPPVSCAFRGCSWHGGHAAVPSSFRDDPEHPWDQELRHHVLTQHAADIESAVKSRLLRRR